MEKMRLIGAARTERGWGVVGGNTSCGVSTRVRRVLEGRLVEEKITGSGCCVYCVSCSVLRVGCYYTCIVYTTNKGFGLNPKHKFYFLK